MDLRAAMVALAPPVVGKVAEILGDIWQDYRTGRQARQGIAVNSQGYYREIPDLAGALSIPRTGVPIEPPVLLTGRFVAEEFFVDLTDLFLDEEEKRVVILTVDENREEIYFFEFDFTGYAIRLWPGCYSFYAFIVDPILDEVLGCGYPYSEGLDDPNPILIGGTGLLEVDFFIFDADDFE